MIARVIDGTADLVESLVAGLGKFNPWAEVRRLRAQVAEAEAEADHWQDAWRRAVIVAVENRRRIEAVTIERDRARVDLADPPLSPARPGF